MFKTITIINTHASIYINILYKCIVSFVVPAGISAILTPPSYVNVLVTKAID